MNENYDAVVIGGRVAGASTALLLARAGVRVALIERSRYGTDTLSTHGLMRAGVLQLTRWGLLGDITAAGTPPIPAATFHYADDESTFVTIRPHAGVDALYAPRRYLLDRILVEAAAAAGAEVRHESTLAGVLRDHHDHVVGVRTVDRKGSPAELRATIVIGADGVYSKVAEQVGAKLLRRARHTSSCLYRYHADVHATGYEWAWGEGAAAGLLPTNDGLTCVFVATRPDRMRRLVRSDGTRAAFLTLLEQAGPELVERVSAGRPVGRLNGWAGVPGFVRRPWGPGWALVGDAGHFKDPLTTHGITDALRDAELLADAVLESLAGGAPQAVALARYQATRDRLSRRLFDTTEAVASFDWTLNEVRGLLRQVSAAMTDEVDHLNALPERCTPAPTTLTEEGRR
jgi:flavin-dependent dehydrogenase